MERRGGPRPNSGRKSNAEKLLDARAAAKSLASWFTPEYQQSKWQALLSCDDPNVQAKAMMYLCDRLYGKAPQAVVHKGEGDGPIEIVVRHIGKRD